MGDIFNHSLDALESAFYGDGWHREPKKAQNRFCTQCDHKFSSAYPKSCPKCSGWTETMPRCAYCRKTSIVNLDGDNLCKEHADAWCRGEGQWQHENYSNTTGETE